MHDFRTGAIEAILLCSVALILFFTLWLVGLAVAAVLRRCFPKTPATEADDAAELADVLRDAWKRCEVCRDHDRLAAKYDVLPFAKDGPWNGPPCPKCGSTMMGNMPFDRPPVRWECHHCHLCVAVNDPRRPVGGA